MSRPDSMKAALIRWRPGSIRRHLPHPLRVVNETMGGLQKLLQNQLDPKIMFDALVRIVEEDASKFRNVIPEAIIPFIQAMEANAWEVGKEDAL